MCLCGASMKRLKISNESQIGYESEMGAFSFVLLFVRFDVPLEQKLIVLTNQNTIIEM